MMYVQFGFNVKLLARLQPVKRKHPKHVQRVSSKAGSAKQLPGHRSHLRRMQRVSSKAGRASQPPGRRRHLRRVQRVWSKTGRASQPPGRRRHLKRLPFGAHGMLPSMQLHASNEFGMRMLRSPVLLTAAHLMTTTTILLKAHC